LIDEHREQDLARVGQQPGRDRDALNGVGSADACVKHSHSGVHLSVGPVSDHSHDIAEEPNLLINGLPGRQ